MGGKRTGYHGGEFVVFKRAAAKADDFCCICDYRAREGLPLYVPSRIFHEGEQIALIRFEGISDSWDRAHSVCATRELARQQALVAEQLALANISPSPAAELVPKARLNRLQIYQSNVKYQVLICCGEQSWEVMRYSDKKEALGAVKLINEWDPAAARGVLKVAQRRAQGSR